MLFSRARSDQQIHMQQNSSKFRPNYAATLARINNEKKQILKDQSPFWYATPLDPDEPLVWHFTIKGPVDTNFANGIYHGKIELPRDYPDKPPSLVFFTENGRFQIYERVCLSASAHHPELWQPSWGIKVLLDALHTFFSTPANGALHGLDCPADVG
eukprot:GHVP01043032.1.p1 GENE.GHVP01043032.1~~GHVP01043032.1.p1  ORF type:complete len:157 (+),score=26.53 GHVP01043032.1:37-507(+)